MLMQSVRQAVTQVSVCKGVDEVRHVTVAVARSLTHQQQVPGGQVAVDESLLVQVEHAPRRLQCPLQQVSAMQQHPSVPILVLVPVLYSVLYSCLQHLLLLPFVLLLLLMMPSVLSRHRFVGFDQCIIEGAMGVKDRDDAGRECTGGLDHAHQLHHMGVMTHQRHAHDFLLEILPTL